MKDNLFEILLHLFEKTLTQLKEKHQAQLSHDEDAELHTLSQGANKKKQLALEVIQSAHPDTMRILTWDEQLKLTKTSYQFLMRIHAWGLLSRDAFELVMNRIIFSESRFVGLQETKWTIRHTLAEHLDSEQLAFLDLVLYQQEDGLALH